VIVRVLHFFKTYWPDSFGGIERAIHAIAIGTSKLGFEPVVLSLSRKPRENSIYFDGHWAYKARLDLEIASTGLSLEAFKHFRELAATADLIHYHFPWPFMDLVHFATRVRKPTVVSYQSDIVKQSKLLQVYRPLMHLFLNSVDRIVVASPNYLETSEHLRRYHAKTTVIPNGLDENAYPKPSEMRLREWRTRFPDPFFLFTGVLRYYKGLHILIEAARLSGYPVVIVGSGPMEHELRAQVDANRLPNVHFVGSLPDEEKVALLTLCRAFVFPSHLRSEAFGLSLVEAAMFSRPMISCEIGTGTSFINRAGETGIVVPPDNPQALASAMEVLIREEVVAQRYGNSARERFLAELTAEKMAVRYAKVYTELTRTTAQADSDCGEFVRRGWT
jgi:glycosyltransferase involved in cell wall biosynthesis